MYLTCCVVSVTRAVYRVRKSMNCKGGEGRRVSHSQQSWVHCAAQHMARMQHLCPGKIPSMAPLTAAMLEGRDVATHCMLHSTGAEGTLWSRTRGGRSTLNNSCWDL